jgi:carbonic anhydrase/acetyltransferase-like protein (isoleucine patch superfamily)
MKFELPDRRIQLVGSDHYIAPSAVLIGAVTLRSGVSIWFGTILRADNDVIVIGADSNVQDGAVLHTDPGLELRIGARVTIGHRSILHGCVVGDGALIGMGTTVLNGAVIGHRCLIGANSLVTEGMRLPDGHLAFGAPARVRRPLSATELAALEDSAAIYRAKGRLYAASLVACV